MDCSIRDNKNGNVFYWNESHFNINYYLPRLLYYSWPYRSANYCGIQRIPCNIFPCNGPSPFKYFLIQIVLRCPSVSRIKCSYIIMITVFFTNRLLGSLIRNRTRSILRLLLRLLLGYIISLISTYCRSVYYERVYQNTCSRFNLGESTIHKMTDHTSLLFFPRDILCNFFIYTSLCPWKTIFLDCKAQNQVFMSVSGSQNKVSLELTICASVLVSDSISMEEHGRVWKRLSTDDECWIEISNITCEYTWDRKDVLIHWWCVP